MIKSFLKFLKSNDFKEFLIFTILGMIIIGICIFIYKCPVKASGTENTAYFPMEQNENSNFTDANIEAINNYFNSENNNLFYYTYSFAYGSLYCYALYFPNSSSSMVYGEIQNNGYNFNIYPINTSSMTIIKFSIVPSTNAITLYPTAGTSPNNYSNLPSSQYNSNYSYVSNFRLMTSNNDDASVVLKYGWQLPPDFMHDTSHATPPDTFEVPVYTTGHTPPTNVPPTYTINNYSWTTYNPPTLDTSNAEKLLESIYNAIVYNGQYLKDNLHGELTNLVNNIGGYFQFIGDTLQYYGNLIISNIQNGITTFYNNINSAIVGIGNAVGYITQPLDMDNLTNAVNSTHIWGDVGTCTTFASDAFGIYGTVAEPNTFKIPLDLRSISLLNITQVYYIDLSWLDGAKSAIRAFMWCVVTFGLLYSIIVDIPNMIKSSK